MKNLIERLAERKTTNELYPPSEVGDELTYEFLVDRNEILDLLIGEARRVKPATVTLTADGGIQVDNPDNLPLSIKDYITTDNVDVDLEDFGEAARMDEDDDWYIERGNQ
jgi:hypothetical protein